MVAAPVAAGVTATAGMASPAVAMSTAAKRVPSTAEAVASSSKTMTTAVTRGAAVAATKPVESAARMTGISRIAVARPAITMAVAGCGRVEGLRRLAVTLAAETGAWPRIAAPAVKGMSVTRDLWHAWVCRRTVAVALAAVEIELRTTVIRLPATQRRCAVIVGKIVRRGRVRP